MFLEEKGGEHFPLDPSVTTINASHLSSKPSSTKVKHWANQLIGMPKKIKFLKETRNRYRIDTTISLLSGPNVLNGICRGGRRIVCERNDPSQKGLGYRVKSIISCNHADYVLFQTRKVMSMFSNRVQKKSCVIPNIVSVSRTADNPSKGKIVSVGRLHPQKNYPMLIRAFAAFCKSNPNYRLHIYGRGAEQNRLEQLVTALQLEDRVVFEGFCDDMGAALSDAEMFVLSSDYEGLSNALIEAMMMGLPCISTACTGSDELITDGENGLLVPIGDEDSLCAAMRRLADDPSFRAQLAYNARIRALDFKCQDVVRKWERVL